MDIPAKTFEPIGTLVVLKMVPVDKSAGGIELPDSVRGKAEMIGLEPAKGWVVSAGCQCRYARRGDLVLLQGQIVHFQHKSIKLAMVSETQLVGIERNDEEEMPEFRVASWKDQTVHRALVLDCCECGKLTTNWVQASTKISEKLMDAVKCDECFKTSAGMMEASDGPRVS